jgi:hypothetical protein
MAAILIPSALSGNFEKHGGIFSSWSSIAYLFLFYFFSYSISIFCNSVIIKAALAHLNGEDITIKECVLYSLRRINLLIGYAFIASTVGLILKIINDKVGLLGKIFTFLASTAWNVITFLVVPVLVVENIGPIDAIKRSAQLLKKTWGENLIGNIGIGFVFGMIVLGLAIITAPIVVILAVKGKMIATIIVGGIFVLISLFLIFITSTLSTIYTAALYRFANMGEAGDIFPRELMEDAFEKK